MLKKWRTGLGVLAVAGATALAGACASTPGGAVDSNVMLRVNNNLIPPTALSVFLLDESTQTLIGTVSPSETEALSIDRVLIGEYRFMARTTLGQEIVSDPVLVPSEATLAWNMNTNTVTTIGSN